MYPGKASAFNTEQWIGRAFNREGWGHLRHSARVPKKYLEMFFYAHLISPTKYPLDFNKADTEVAFESVRNEMARSIDPNPDRDSVFSEFIVGNARLRILSNGNLRPLAISELEKEVLKRFVTKRCDFEKSRPVSTSIIDRDEILIGEILFSLKVAYPELCEFPRWVMSSFRHWLDVARKAEEWALFLQYALSLYTLSATEIKVVNGLPVFVLPEDTLTAAPISPIPTDLKF